MSVSIVLPFASKAGTSNKPEVELGLVAIFDPLTKFLKPRVLGPIIDKITITYDIKNKTAQDAIVELYAASLQAGAQYKEAGYKTKASSAYAINAILTEPASGEAILIQVGRKKSKKTAIVPPKKKLSFMRLEFNPDKLKVKGLNYLKEELSKHFLGQYSFKDIAATGRVTRIDLAADLLYVRSDQLIYSSAKGGKSISYFGVSGTLESSYLEKKSSSAKVAIYNKRQEQKDIGGDPFFGSVNHTRIERHVSTTLVLINLHNLSNPFKDLTIVSPLKTVTPPEEYHHWLMFLDSCRFRGVEKALALLPSEDLKVKYKETLKSADEGIWNPVTIWKNWPKRLSSSGLL